VLGKLARQHDPNVLVGFDHADDAGVYLIAPDQALVQTVDFFTPIVDDPYAFGQIAATNALSDVYAMGGKPLTALALVCFPEKADLEILERILAGGLSKMVEAGCTVIGGHSIRDEETKFGYSVTGTVHPKKVLANAGARPGDSLLFTKRIGTGVISTAIKKGKAEAPWIDAAERSMTTLNKRVGCFDTNFRWESAIAGGSAGMCAGKICSCRTEEQPRLCGVPGGVRRRSARRCANLVVRSADRGGIADFHAGRRAFARGPH
jgi:selenide,water dikinase